MSSGKSIKRERVENDFEALLTKLRPWKDLFKAESAMLKQLQDHGLKPQRKQTATLES